MPEEVVVTSDHLTFLQSKHLQHASAQKNAKLNSPFNASKYVQK
jgi:hypothetical protein